MFENEIKKFDSKIQKGIFQCKENIENTKTSL